MNAFGSESVFSALKNSVVFILSENGSESSPIGTAFVVRVSDNNNPNRYSPFIVTNKHVLQNIDRDPNGTFNGSQFYGKVRVRLNAPSGDKYLVSELKVADNVFVHSNPAVDLAVVPAALPQSNVVSTCASVVFGNLAANCPSFVEGRDTMSVSLLQNYSGIERNHAVCRFGKLALVTDESWCDSRRGCGPEQAWLIDLGTYEGASGSPVYLVPIQWDIDGNGNVIRHSGALALVGVVKAVFNSPSDPFLQLRALTPVEPVKNLQDIFEQIFTTMRADGWDPMIRRSGSSLIEPS